MSEQNNSTAVSAEGAASAPRFDWLKKYPQDRIGLRPEDQVVVVKELASCFATVEAFDNFMAANFDNDFGVALRQLVDPNKSVLENADACFRYAWDRRLITPLIMAVQDANQSNMILGLVAAHFLPFFREREPWIWPWAEDGTPVKGSVADPEVKVAKVAAAAAPVSAPREFKVVRALVKLNAEQLRDLGKLITGAFSQSDLETVCHLATGERLEVVVQNGPLRKMAIDLVTYTENEDKLPALLNEMLKRRPHRDDIKPFYEKLAEEGALEIEK
jgi:hypothetical protein